MSNCWRRLFSHCTQVNIFRVAVHCRRMRGDATDSIADMRISYDVSELLDDQLPAKDPFELFNIWFQEAVKHPSIVEPNAMNLATASKEGIPSARFVLLKGVSEDGFRFFTNLGSQKGQELNANPHAAITFYWEPLQKQVRINGIVERVSFQEADQYFHQRPVESQLGAVASRQTTVLPNRQALEDKKEALSKEYEGKRIPKPDFWGGFRVQPTSMEFWCGGRGRLHDRIRFRKIRENEILDPKLTKQGENGWLYERLSP